MAVVAWRRPAVVVDAWLLNEIKGGVAEQISLSEERKARGYYLAGLPGLKIETTRETHYSGAIAGREGLFQLKCKKVG